MPGADEYAWEDYDIIRDPVLLLGELWSVDEASHQKAYCEFGIEDYRHHSATDFVWSVGAVDLNVLLFRCC
jgi:hypothetical protein